MSKKLKQYSSSPMSQDDQAPATKQDIKDVFQALMTALEAMENRTNNRFEQMERRRLEDKAEAEKIRNEDKAEAEKIRMEDKAEAEKIRNEDKAEAEKIRNEDKAEAEKNHQQESEEIRRHFDVVVEDLKYDVLGALKDVRSNDYQVQNHEERIGTLEEVTGLAA